MDFKQPGRFPLWQHLCYSVRHRGLRRTLLLGWAEWRKERELGLQTLGACPAPFGAMGGHMHQPSSSVLFAEAVRVLPEWVRQGVFYDVGHGKGRALALAAEAGFRKAIGVELSAELSRDAESNLPAMRQRFPHTEFHLIHADALAHPVPEEADVAYLFNPFDGPATRQWAAGALAGRQRGLFVILMHPLHLPALMGGCPALRLVSQCPLGEYAVLEFVPSPAA